MLHPSSSHDALRSTSRDSPQHTRTGSATKTAAQRWRWRAAICINSHFVLRPQPHVLRINNRKVMLSSGRKIVFAFCLVLCILSLRYLFIWWKFSALMLIKFYSLNTFVILRMILIEKAMIGKNGDGWWWERRRRWRKEAGGLVVSNDRCEMTTIRKRQAERKITIESETGTCDDSEKQRRCKSKKEG